MFVSDHHSDYHCFLQLFYYSVSFGSALNYLSFYIFIFILLLLSSWFVFVIETFFLQFCWFYKLLVIGSTRIPEVVD